MAMLAKAMTIMRRPDLLVCDDCELLYQRRTLHAGERLNCQRCGATLARGSGMSAEGQLALTVAALVVFAIASLSPIVTLELNGIRAVASLFEAVRDTWQTGERVVAVLALATAFVFPLLVIVLRLWLLLPLVAGRRAAGFARVMRALRWFMRWSMVEVFMLAVLVAVVRSAGVSQLVTGPGLYGYAALVLLMTAIQACGLEELWHLDDKAMA